MLTKLRLKLFSLMTIVLMYSTSAHAALSEAEQAALDSITSKVTDYTAPALAVCVAVIGLFISIKWIKKITTKVS